jgi:hypothetical protein
VQHLGNCGIQAGNPFVKISDHLFDRREGICHYDWPLTQRIGLIAPLLAQPCQCFMSSEALAQFVIESRWWRPGMLLSLVGILGQHPCREGISLAAMRERSCPVMDLLGIDDANVEVSSVESNGETYPVAAGGFEHNQRVGGCDTLAAELLLKGRQAL